MSSAPATIAPLQLDLSAYLQTVAKRSFVWGESDCVSTMLGWLEICLGRNIRAELAYQWASEQDALKGLDDGGGLVRGGLILLGQKAGLSRTRNPKRGDVGVIRIVRKPYIMRAASIYTGTAWAFTIEPGGLSVERTRPLIAWSLPADIAVV